MGVQNVTINLTRAGKNSLLLDGLRKTADPGADGTFTKAHVGLFISWPGFAEDLATADLTEATYGGYARSAPVNPAPEVDPTGRAETIAASLVFTPTDSTASSRCLGIGIYDAATAGNLLGVGVFDSAVTLAGTSDTASITVKVAMPIDNADWGVGGLVN